MAGRPKSADGARRAMREGLQRLNDRDQKTYCQDRPVPFADVRQSVSEAAALCHKGKSTECPLLAACYNLGHAESVHANDMVYGGLPWRKGKPVTSDESKPKKTRKKRA